MEKFEPNKDDIISALKSLIKKPKVSLEIKNVEDKNTLDSSAIILLSDADENAKIKAIEALGDRELEGEKLGESEIKLLANIYDHESSAKVRLSILGEFYAHLSGSALAIDKIVYAAKFDKDKSVKNDAIDILKEFKKNGLIDAVLEESQEAIKNRMVQLITEMKKMKIWD